MTKPVMNFEEVQAVLKQRFPMLMIDSVVSLEPGKNIKAIKNVTGNELQFLGHFPGRAVMPATLIVEAIGQAASILFAKTTGTGIAAGDFLVLGSLDGMRFLVPVVPGERMEIDVVVSKFVGDRALVEGTVRVNEEVVATGKLGFARRSL
ncbi:MAG TPA: 3-hydroxyacyl-ACP dehydratase FabZ [Verrucomicrobiae bacterium]|nr:3-hydroxyacyl-ACP dehydratase FabZ [Verrucomicrobiae bacterium]